MQKQAVLVCSVCALAAILTIAITMTLLKRGKNPAAPVEQPSSEVLVPGEEDISDHYQISETSAALLPETADAGESYQKETLFLGDSNTVRLYANGLISLQQFCAKEGIGTHAALNEGIVTFKKDSSTYTIAQAVAKMKPRRVVIMLGTNDTGMSVDEFIKNYTALVHDLGIDTVISPKDVTASQISSYVRGLANSQGSAVESLHKILGGAMEAVEFTATGATHFLNTPLKDLNFKPGLLVAAIVHGGKLLIPGGHSIISEGDRVIVVAKSLFLKDLNDILVR